MNILGAVIAGLVASLVFSMVLVMAPKMGMTNHGGLMAFMGGLVGHMIFG